MFSEFTLTPTRPTENTVEKETVKIADKQAPVCWHLKQKTTGHFDEELRLEIFKTDWKFSQLFFSCYVRILEQGSKIHGEPRVSRSFAGQFPIFFRLFWSFLILIPLTLY